MCEKDNHQADSEEDEPVSITEGFRKFPETTKKAAQDLKGMLSETKDKGLGIKVVEREPQDGGEADSPDGPEAA